MTYDDFYALKNLVMFLAGKATTKDEDEFEQLTMLIGEVEDAFPEQATDHL